MKENNHLNRQIVIVLLVATVFMFYMEMIYLPHFMPVFYHDYALLSYPLELRDESYGRVLHISGVLLFCLTIFGGRSLISLLESLRGESDNLGCISAYGRYKENANDY